MNGLTIAAIIVDEIRVILVELREGSKALAAERLARLAEHVAQLYAAPTAELDAVRVGLDVDQEIRARALAEVRKLLGGDHHAVRTGPILWDLAEQAAAYIRDGSRP
jgi:hypothetical protein